MPKRIVNRCSNRNLDMNVHCNTIHNSQKVETAQMSINWYTDKQKVVYLYNEILFSHEKGWSTDTYHNIDEPWKHNAKWKKPVTKDDIVYYSIYTKYPE